MYKELKSIKDKYMREEYDYNLYAEDIDWLIKTVEDLHSELQETNDLCEHLGDKVGKYKNKISELDSVMIKTHQKATERINKLEKRIQELEPYEAAEKHKTYVKGSNLWN